MKFQQSPRFNESEINEKRRMPGPTHYSQTEAAKGKDGVIPKQIRFRDDRYETISQGPGAYRHQDGFGIYCIEAHERMLAQTQTHDSFKPAVLKSPNSTFEEAGRLSLAIPNLAKTQTVKRQSKFLSKLTQEDLTYKTIVDDCVKAISPVLEPKKS